MAGVCALQMERMLHSGTYADFRITCDGAVFPVHKMVLASASDFFRAMFESGFRESEQGIAEFPEDNAEAMGTILHYLYTGEYLLEPTESFVKWMASVTSKTSVTSERTIPSGTAPQADPILSRSPSDNIHRHILAYQAADKFSMQAIQDEIYKFFTTRGASTLLQDPGLIGQLDLLYSVTMAGEDQLRLYVTQQCLTHSSSLLSRSEVVSVIMKHEPTTWVIGTRYQSKVAQLTSRALLLVPTIHEKNELNDQLANERIETGKLRSQNLHMESEKSTLMTKNASLTTRNTALSKDNGNLKAEVGKLKSQVGNLKSQVGNLKVQVSKVNTRNNNLSEAAKELDGKVSQLQNDLDHQYHLNQQRFQKGGFRGGYY